MFAFNLPSVPASCAALLWDAPPRDGGRLLIVNPTYKSGWTLPGGIMEADGETPWDACRREVLEEVGLVVTEGRLVCVDTRPAKHPAGRLGLRFVFDCGVLTPEQIETITPQKEELSEHRFATPAEANTLLSKPVRRRVRRTVRNLLRGGQFLYLENGRRVPGVSDRS